MSIHTDLAVQELSKEIDRLTAMRDSLLTAPYVAAPTKSPKAPAAETAAPAPAPTKVPLSPETKKRIAEAQKRRWEKIKKSAAAPAKAAAKK
jgi:hypothetical protein